MSLIGFKTPSQLKPVFCLGGQTGAGSCTASCLFSLTSMETFNLWVSLLLGFLLSEIGLSPSSAVPPQIAESSKHTALKSPSEEPHRVHTVRVSCYPDSLEIVIDADMFGVGAPVNSADIRLGVEQDGYCTAAASSGNEYSILVGLLECGTKHWMTEDSLVYTNLLIYSPEVSPDGLIRMEEAVIPIECHYGRKYSLSSSSIKPTWIPYTSTQAAVETLQFDLRIMTSDWMYERSSNVFHLGMPISIEASVRVGHHMGLRVFVSSCVATLHPDINSAPRYVFLENGCLLDSQLPGSRSHFLPRTQDDKLRLLIDAFRFHNDDRGELYITCHLNAVPVSNTESPDKACTLNNGRWSSADGNDYLCWHCQNQNEVGQIPSKPSSPRAFGPRGFVRPEKPESFWRSTVTSKGWEQEAKVGPLLVLPGKQRSGPLPEDEIPRALLNIGRPVQYGSKWRSGINYRVDGEVAAPVEELHPAITLESESAEMNTNDTEALSDVLSTDVSATEVTEWTNATTT
uniref:Zona pellucida sperm-binding protein 3 n=1 Tax=Labrus bergylta TaxID=56723 RepID=A0A3Q3ETY7_9LABR